MSSGCAASIVSATVVSAVSPTTASCVATCNPFFRATSVYVPAGTGGVVKRPAASLSARATMRPSGVSTRICAPLTGFPAASMVVPVILCLAGAAFSAARSGVVAN